MVKTNFRETPVKLNIATGFFIWYSSHMCIVRGIVYSKPLIQGFWDYNDLATSTTPIPISANTDTLITNDGLGASTNKEYGINGIQDIYNTTTQSFDWSRFDLGDTIDIRLDLTLTTDSPNTDVSAFLRLGTGLAQYDLPFISDRAYKIADDHRILEWSGVYIGDLNTRDNGGKLYINMDNTGDLVVNGWYCRALIGGR